jgi:hypothetical protein
MKKENESARTGSKKAGKAQGGNAAVQLAALLELTAEQTQALALIAEWEGMTVAEYGRLYILAGMDSSFDDIQGFAGAIMTYQPTARERAWAKSFYGRVSALRGGKRWGA